MKKVILLMVMIGIILLVGCVKKEPSSKELAKLLNFEEVPTAVNTLVFAETYSSSSNNSLFAFTFRQGLEKPCIVYSPKVSYYGGEAISSLLYCPLLLADEINDNDDEAIKFTAIRIKENIYELKHLEVAGFVFEF